MKLLLINSVCGIRSTGRIVTDIANEYKAKGYECRIAYGREKVPDECKSISYRIGSDINIYFDAAKSRILDNDGFNSVNATKKFIKWADEYDPDVLWLHNLHGYYINLELLFAWIKHRKNMEVRWTLHDCWPFTGHCAHFSYVRCEKWKKQCEKCCQKREYPSSILLDRSYFNYIKKKELFCGVERMTIITPSYWLADLAKQSFLSEYPVEVVHNEIDKGIFKPTIGDFRVKYGLQNKKVILGVASSWNEKKGLSDFIKLAQVLDERFIVILVGVTQKQVKNIPSDIICIQRTDDMKQLAEIYSAADVFLNLTYEDTYPTVNLEAQACGTPCITYRTGGSIESVSSDCIVEQGDIDTLLSKITKVIEGKI